MHRFNLDLNEMHRFLSAVTEAYEGARKDAYGSETQPNPSTPAGGSMSQRACNALGEVMTMLQEERDNRISDIAYEALCDQMGDIFKPLGKDKEVEILQIGYEKVLEDTGNAISSSPHAYDDCVKEAKRSAMDYVDNHPLNPKYDMIRDVAAAAINDKMGDTFKPLGEDFHVAILQIGYEKVFEDTHNAFRNGAHAYDDCVKEAKRSAMVYVCGHPLNPHPPRNPIQHAVWKAINDQMGDIFKPLGAGKMEEIKNTGYKKILDDVYGVYSAIHRQNFRISVSQAHADCVKEAKRSARVYVDNHTLNPKSKSFSEAYMSLTGEPNPHLSPQEVQLLPDEALPPTGAHRGQGIRDVALDAIRDQMGDIFKPLGKDKEVEIGIIGYEKVFEDTHNAFRKGAHAYDDCVKEAKRSARVYVDNHPLNPKSKSFSMER